jgi:hypothetical protein
MADANVKTLTPSRTRLIPAVTAASTTQKPKLLDHVLSSLATESQVSASYVAACIYH